MSPRVAGSMALAAGHDQDGARRFGLRLSGSPSDGSVCVHNRAPRLSSPKIISDVRLLALNRQNPRDARPGSIRLNYLAVVLALLQVASEPVSGNKQQALSSQLFGASGERPRLIPLVAAESGYSENSSVNVLCTVSQGHHETLTFEWFKDGQLLARSEPVPSYLGPSSGFAELLQPGQPLPAGSQPQIEKHSDHSLLRIARVQWHHSGRYTCSAKNQFGQDSSSVNLIVNVKLQWSKEPPQEIAVSLNQELKVDCLAQGEPKPNMRWEKLESPPTIGRSKNTQGGFKFSQTTSANPEIIIGANKNQLASNSNSAYKLAQQQPSSQSSVLFSSTRYLNIQRARESDAGIYECIASNSHDADLRKLVHVQVRGPPKILPIATADSYPEGSSINLICTVSGGQRRGLVLSWRANGEELDAQKLRDLDAFDNVSIGTDEADISILRIKNATNNNSGLYTCTAKNPLGQDSTSVKIVINVELKWNKIPKDTEVGLDKELSIECDAVGSPAPTIEWFKHGASGDRRSTNMNGTALVGKGKLLRIAKAQHRDSGLYECIARNGVDEDLRKIVQVKVRDTWKNTSSLVTETFCCLMACISMSLRRV